ncbi:MAG: sugar ABC transporter ATP-binding protein [Mesorhizobium sp.]|nr:MAG: sugar ABC transporter ATP-binding protein [Mesorhizobium sp.]
MTLLSLRGIRKSFGAVDVLHGVDLSVAAGEVVGLVGDNGAGKSTLMKTITGIYRADSGSIEFDGKDILALDPGHRRQLGIEMIYQDLSLAKQQDVASNIFLGREPTKRLFGLFPGFVDKGEMDRQASKMIERLGAHLPSINRSVGSFSGGQQQTVAIARALTFDPKLVIMDEPTAAISVRQVAEVLNLIRHLRDQGIAVVLISHRMPDVFDVADRVIVMRRGRKVADKKIASSSPEEVTGLITGAIEQVA